MAKKKTQKSNTFNESQAGSITSFFSNTPPCKFACPLCGKLVPRYKINEHIDSQCQTFLGEDREDALRDSREKQEKTIKTPSNGVVSRSDDKGVGNPETSPYFKKNSVLKHDSSETSSQARVDKTVGLGSLSSRLSRRSTRLPSTSGVSADDNGGLSSSQKENMTFESKSSCVLETGNIFPCGPIASDQLVEKSVAETSSSHSGKSPSSSRVLKRRSNEGDTNPSQAVTVHKKSRFPIFRGQETNRGSDQTDVSSVVPSSTSQSKKESALKVIEKTPTDEPETLTTTDGSENGSTRQPYYLQNFRTVLDSVLENEDDRMLFNEDDFSIIYTFQKLSGKGHSFKKMTFAS